MKKIVYTIFILTIGINIVNGQDEQAHYLIEKYQVNKIETYFFEPNQSLDSLLITIERFNKKGRRTKIEIYDSLALKWHFDYFYLLDTIKIERRSYRFGELSSITHIENDDLGNELTTITYDELGNESGWHTKKSYNKDHQETDYKAYIYKKITLHEKRKYYENGNLKLTKVVKPKELKRTIKYDKDGKEIQNINSECYTKTIDNYKDPGKQMEQIFMQRKYKNSTIGIKGRIDLTPNDMLQTNIFYKVNGLIDYKIQYLNEILIGKKKYKYLVD